MPKFTSFLAPLVQDYRTYQQASGRWNDASYEPNLLLFDRYCKQHYPGAAGLSQEMVDTWCRQRDTETNNSRRSRIYVVASFIEYLRTRGKTRVFAPAIPKKEKRTYIPHAFREAELMSSCDSLPDVLRTSDQRSRKMTIPVFFRLLYSSGLRTNEARMLRVEDVD